MRVTLSEINNNSQDTNREGKEARTHTNDLEHKEEINIQPEQNEETRIKKKTLTIDLGTTGTSPNMSTSES